MKRFAMAALFAAAILSMNSYANADALDAMELAAGGPGATTSLQDDDWEIMVQSNGSISAPGSNTLGIGDFFVGMLRISDVNGPAPNPPGPAPDPDFTDFDEDGGFAITALFAIKVLGVDVDGAIISTFLTDAEWAAIGLNALGFTREPKVGGSTTVAIVFNDPDNLAPDPAGDGDVSNDLQNGPTGPRLWEFGFGTDNFWRTTGAVIGATIPATGERNFALFDFGLDLTHTYAAGADIVFHDRDNGTFLGIGPTGTFSHLHGSGSVFPEDPTAPEDFDLVSDVDLRVSISAVPEPGSMVLLGMGAMGVFGAGYRRRRQAQKQQAV